MGCFGDLAPIFSKFSAFDGMGGVLAPITLPFCDVENFCVRDLAWDPLGQVTVVDKKLKINYNKPVDIKAPKPKVNEKASQ